MNAIAHCIVFIRNGLKKVPENYHQKTINHLTKDDYENNNTRQNIVAVRKKNKTQKMNI